MGRLRIKPLEEIPLKRDGDVKWMQPPAYPSTVDAMMKEVRRQVDEYYGRSNDAVPQDLVNLLRQFKVMWWLANLRELLNLMWQTFVE